MLFNSTVFLFLFLPVTYAGFWTLTSKNARYAWLAASGYVFYGFWNPAYCLLMALSTAISYSAGLGFLRWNDDPRIRRWLLVLPITADLGLLGYFKYANFSIKTLNTFLGWAGAEPLPLLHVLLPIGISFYTFHTISYIVDSYLEVITPTRNPLEFACYVSLFSQLVAGPIVRFRELEGDLDKIDRANPGRLLDSAWSFFAIGLVQKVLVADTIAAIVDPALQDAAHLSTAGLWMCMLGFTYQIYFDFAGYSNMAVGLGLLFGFHIPQNFNSPYRALNPADFWRRWHMTLSRCFRDYVFLPWLGRRPSRLRLAGVTFGTMALCGLWHGAHWTFIAWGAYHGLLLVFYERCSSIWDARPPWLQRVVTFLLVTIGLTIFRATGRRNAATLLTGMFTFHAGVPLVGGGTLAAMLVLAAGFSHFGRNTFELSHEWRPATALSLGALFLLCLAVIYGGKNSPFLYFQF